MLKTRLTLCLILAALSGCTGASRLHRDIDSPDWQTRSAAVGNLRAGKLNDTSVPLILRALDDTVPQVRDYAAYVLAHHVRNGTAGNLYEHARHASDSAKIAVAAATQGRHFPDAANDFLLELLGPSSPDVQLAAAKALQNSGDARKREPLVELWRNSADEALQIAALVSASYPAKDAREDEELRECWRQLAIDQPRLLRDPYVLQAAGGMRVEETGTHILELVTEPELRYLAIESLGRMRHADAVPVLLTLLDEDESWVLTRQACEALGRIRSPEAAPVLARMFVESRPETNRDAWDRTMFIALAMIKIGGDEVFEALVSQITNEHKRSLSLACLHEMTGTRLIARDNYWLYTWEGMQERWRRWWSENREKVAERLDARANDSGE